jgi:hypothetical protein
VRISNDVLRDALSAALVANGFAVERYLPTRHGTLDIFATRDGAEIAIDVERAEPGPRAVAKLRPFLRLKVIVLRLRSRRPRRQWHPPAGIHDIIDAP